MRVSPFTPLFFVNHRTDGIASDYVQTFATTDRILLQLIGEPGWNGTAKVYMEPCHEELYEIVFNTWAVNDETILLFHTMALSPGLYSVEISDIGSSTIFRVTDDARVLDKTTLIQYSMHNNRQRTDAIFYIDGMQHFFDFRVPGGFKESGWAFEVDTEQFSTDAADIMSLYAIDSIQQTFTLGTSRGCPIWFGALLNRLLCCTYVYFDGVRYARKDASVPEVNQQLDGVNSFVFTQTLQRVVNLDPNIEQSNHVAMRRIDSGEYRSISSTINRLTL